jgi:hypothetical protein
MKCGICHKNKIAKRTTPAASMLAVPAVQPSSGGMAPGIAPTWSAYCECCFSGVYAST